jgi:hypothetical protein
MDSGREWYAFCWMFWMRVVDGSTFSGTPM